MAVQESLSEHESRACSKVPQTRMSSGSEQTSRVHLRPLDPAPRRSDYFEKMGDLKTGMYFYARCAEVATEVDARESVAKANLSLGLCEEKQGHWEEAMKSARGTTACECAFRAGGGRGLAVV